MNMEVITIESVAYQQLMGRIESIASHIERLEATRGVQGIPDTLLNTWKSHTNLTHAGKVF